MRPVNREAIIEIAKALEPLYLKFVFTGACVLPFLVDKAFTSGLRTTEDVDVIVQLKSQRRASSIWIMSQIQMHDVEEKLRAVGFQNDFWSKHASRCRWLFSDIVVGVMSDDQNDRNSCPSKWFQFAVETAVSLEIKPGLAIHHASAVAFLATKLEAFANRGDTDCYESKDLEDIIALTDGRESLLSEVESAPLEVRRFIAGQIADRLSDIRFPEIVSGHLSVESRRSGRDARITNILKKLKGFGDTKYSY